MVLIRKSKQRLKMLNIIVLTLLKIINWNLTNTKNRRNTATTPKNISVSLLTTFLEILPEEFESIVNKNRLFKVE